MFTYTDFTICFIQTHLNQWVIYCTIDATYLCVSPITRFYYVSLHVSAIS
jgi:hypothetical protein